ncbi:MAG: glycosyltransferase family 39 protein [Herpetosiphonaceae bacterium]|nr:glycosyltransferase family 39 protein [Herpetosiphonaceae bacterium]
MLKGIRRADPLVLVAAVVAGLLWVLISQLPAQHRVDVGGADAAYVQGFAEREQADAPAAQPYLAGATNARALTAESALLFPQAGTPAAIAIRWRTITSTPLSSTVLLNGAAPLGIYTAYPDWSVTRIPIGGGQAKPSGDWFVTFAFADPESIYIDRVIYNVGPGPVTPAPLPLAAVSLAAALLTYLLPRRWTGGWRVVVGAGAVVLLLALLYRWPPPLLGYPVRQAPHLLVAGLLVAVGVRWAPALGRAPRRLEAGLVGGGLLLWAGWVWTLGRQHLVLSLPGVEADFSVFAKRSATWAEVWRADGFYQLGYPLLLRLVRPLMGDNPFLAARWLSLGAALVLLLATWWLARARWGRVVGLLALLLAALNPLTVQYALYVGTDMVFAAACIVAIAVALHRPIMSRRAALLAGAAAGIAFMLRHPGLLLLPWMLAVAYRSARDPAGSPWAARLRGFVVRPATALLVLGFLLGAGPQIGVNLRDTGQPLYSQQAKNIWLAVYGNTEFSRWDEESSAIGLGTVIQRDPVRFLGNWWNNLVAFSGTGGARAAEFERAVQLRLLAWPFNLLALLGLVGWARRWRSEPAGVALLGWALLYVVGICVGFLLPRFVVALIPVYALAAGTLLGGWWGRPTPGADLARRNPRRLALLGLGVGLLGLGQAGAGAQVVLDQQVATERAIVAAILGNVPAEAPIAAQVAPRTAIAKYSAVAERLSPSQGDLPGDVGWLVVEGAAPPGWLAVARAGELGLYKR